MDYSEVKHNFDYSLSAILLRADAIASIDVNKEVDIKNDRNYKDLEMVERGKAADGRRLTRILS